MRIASNLMNVTESDKLAACWKNYEQVGTKMLDGREVPNCVPRSDDIPNSKPQKRKKTEKKSSTLASESIVDVPIKCTPGFGCKRYLTPQEMVEVEAAKQKILPDLLATSAEPISSQMSSPGWSAAGHGLAGALLGAGLGAGAGKITGSNLPLSMALGGLVGGLGGGLYGYGSKLRKNKEIEDLMEDMPVGADMGDVEVFSDPRFRAQLARDFQRQLVRKGLMG